ncbi:MAG: hypothetical protein AAF411_21145 [Myxococcota bacterium]
MSNFYRLLDASHAEIEARCARWVANADKPELIDTFDLLTLSTAKKLRYPPLGEVTGTPQSFVIGDIPSLEVSWSPPALFVELSGRSPSDEEEAELYRDAFSAGGTLDEQVLVVPEFLVEMLSSDHRPKYDSVRSWLRARQQPGRLYMLIIS